ncbi:hypothetical protein LINGRAHAP2_LOCUS6880 [Linum grandiflorum]
MELIKGLEGIEYIIPTTIGSNRNLTFLEDLTLECLTSRIIVSRHSRVTNTTPLWFGHLLFGSYPILANSLQVAYY